jgi:hypothetical protein
MKIALRIIGILALLAAPILFGLAVAGLFIR